MLGMDLQMGRSQTKGGVMLVGRVRWMGGVEQTEGRVDTGGKGSVDGW